MSRHVPSRCSTDTHSWRGLATTIAGLAFVLVAPPLSLAQTQAQDATLPPIRSSPANRVPACVTPEHLMSFLTQRNPTLSPRLLTIARSYRDVGEKAQVRWDYAFFQMALETNYLLYRRGDGSSGDVNATQNNFAGIGATGGGVPGDRYPDVTTGVLAHIQHLVAYSGEHVASPVATRTRERQNDIIELSRKLNRPVTFSDLSRRWAVDRAYARNIETIATLYRRTYCSAPTPTVTATRYAPPNRLGAPAATTDVSGALSSPDRSAAEGARHLPLAKAPTIAKRPTALTRTLWRRPRNETALSSPAPDPIQVPTPDQAPATTITALIDQTDGQAPGLPPSLDQAPTNLAHFARVAEVGLTSGARIPGATTSPTCLMRSASYGGSRTALIKVGSRQAPGFDLVTVDLARDRVMAETYVAQHATDGEIVGIFDTRADAIATARAVCRTASRS